MRGIYLNQLFLFLSVAALVLVIFLNNHQAGAASETITTTVAISVCGNGIKEGGEHCDGSDLGGRACSNLGYSGGSLACSASCEFSTVSCTTDAETFAIPLFTTGLGGSFTLNNSGRSAEIDLSTDFYWRDLRLEMFSYVASYFDSLKPAPEDYDFAGKTYDFVFTDPDGSNVTTISNEATLSFSYTDADVGNLIESTIKPYYYPKNGSAWQLIGGSVLDAVNNTVTFPVTSFRSFALLGLVAVEEEEEEEEEEIDNSGGGGGGGGGGGFTFVAPPTSVQLNGRAYPGSLVTVLKDAQVAASTVAGGDARFEVTVAGLSAGSYIFSVYSEDDQGRRSALQTFPISVTLGTSTKIGGVFISPTVSVDKSEVKRGENIAIFGQSIPEANVTIAINSEQEFFGSAIADEDGIYLYNFNTAVLEYGQHSTKSKAAVSGEISSFSRAVGFQVGLKTVLAQEIGALVRADVNNDRRVNLVDFSIAAYWYKRSAPPAHIDLNSDGKVDLVDFSIMAFHWTG